MNTKGINVLLVYANSFMDNLIPLGLSILSACLKKAGHQTRLFDTTFYRTKEKAGDNSRAETLQIIETNLDDYGVHEKKTDMINDFKKMIDDFKPQLIAVSAVEPTYNIALKLLESVKELKMSKVIGGPLATFAAEDIIQNEFIDILCIGEGEEAIVELADAISEGKDYSNIQNLWIKRDGIVIKNPIRDLISLDNLPLQDWSIYEKERFFKPMGGKINISGVFELARGCNHKCTYCCNPIFQKIYEGKGHFLRYRSIKNFINELEGKVKKYNLGYVYFVAENFLAMPPKMFDEFIDEYKKFKIPFYFNTRIETITEEKIKKLEEVNCALISIGVEHGNEQFRRGMLNRFLSNDVLINKFKILKKANIRACTSNMIGLPDETRGLVFDTIRVNKQLNPDSILVNIFNPYKGTKLYDHSVEKGYYKKAKFAGDNRSDLLLNMPQLTPEQIKGLHRTFVLYVRLPESMWPQIEIAEKFDEEGNKMFEKLKKTYFDEYKNIGNKLIKVS